jgi:hypothetical protein
MKLSKLLIERGGGHLPAGDCFSPGRYYKGFAIDEVQIDADTAGKYKYKDTGDVLQRGEHAFEIKISKDISGEYGRIPSGIPEDIVYFTTREAAEAYIRENELDEAKSENNACSEHNSAGGEFKITPEDLRYAVQVLRDKMDITVCFAEQLVKSYINRTATNNQSVLILNGLFKNINEESPAGGMSAASGGVFGTWVKDSYGDKNDARVPRGVVAILRRALQGKKKKLTESTKRLALIQRKVEELKKDIKMQ